jgi:Holliday junction resolvase-like predicted endonuclease
MSFSQRPKSRENSISPVSKIHLETALSSKLLPVDLTSKEKIVLRSSGLPFCGVRTVMGRLDSINTFSSFMSLYYTSVGTAVHSTWQKAMISEDVGENVFGDWSCSICKAKFKQGFKPLCKATPCDLTYEELTLSYKNLTGHCDLVARYGETWTLWELKTAGVTNSTYKPFDFKPQHRIQTLAYSFMLQENYNISIENINIIYKERQYHFGYKDFKFPYTSELKDDIKTQIDYWNFCYTLSVKPFSNLNFKKVFDNRPCLSKEDYFDPLFGMCHGFHEKEEIKGKWVKIECSFLDICTSKSKSLQLDFVNKVQTAIDSREDNEN